MSTLLIDQFLFGEPADTAETSATPSDTPPVIDEEQTCPVTQTAQPAQMAAPAQTAADKGELQAHLFDQARGGLPTPAELRAQAKEATTAKKAAKKAAAERPMQPRSRMPTPRPH